MLDSTGMETNRLGIAGMRAAKFDTFIVSFRTFQQTQGQDEVEQIGLCRRDHKKQRLDLRQRWSGYLGTNCSMRSLAPLRSLTIGA